MTQQDFLYLHISIPNWYGIQRELRSILSYQPPKNMYHIVPGGYYRSSFPLLYAWFDACDLTPVMVADMRVEGHHPAHVDIWEGVLGLNLPVDNCDASITRFWSSSAEGERVASTSIPHWRWSFDQLRERDRYSLTGPVITNTSVIHSVESVGGVRRSLSFRFLRDPWELAGVDQNA